MMMIQQGRVQQGILIMLLAMLMVPVMDVINKVLVSGLEPFGPNMSPIQVSFLRFVFQAVLMTLFIAARSGSFWVQPSLLIWVILRGVLMAATTLLFFSALFFMAVTESIAIFFVEPLLLTILSALILRESIGWRRISAVIIGLIGAMIVIRPSFLAVGWAALLPLGAAFGFAFYLLLTKFLSERVDGLCSHFWAGVSGAIFLGFVALFMEFLMPPMYLGGVTPLQFIWPESWQWVALTGLGLIATFGHYLIIMAFARAPAAVLAPLQYFEMVSATLLGWFVFQHFPDAMTWLGIGIIISSGLFVFYRQKIRNG